MYPVGVRISKTLEKEVERVAREEQVDKSTAIRMLLEFGIEEWRLKRALGMLREGKVSVWKAAEIAGMNLWDFTRILKKEDIEWVELEEARKS